MEKFQQGKTFVMGDPHGALKAIKQVLSRAEFDFERDTLIVLGDVADGWSEVAESVDFLIEEVKNLIYVRGNHDQWLKEFLQYGRQPLIWTMQGGQATWLSYMKNPELMKKHLAFFKKTPSHYIDSKRRVYVHGGIKPNVSPNLTPKRYLQWDRDLWDLRHKFEASGGIGIYKEVFVGHTDIWRFSHKPINYANIWLMDTGAGWAGKLSIMDVDTKELFQSDVVKELYPWEKGRN